MGTHINDLQMGRSLVQKGSHPKGRNTQIGTGQTQLVGKNALVGRVDGNGMARGLSFERSGGLRGFNPKRSLVGWVQKSQSPMIYYGKNHTNPDTSLSPLSSSPIIRWKMRAVRWKLAGIRRHRTRTSSDDIRRHRTPSDLVGHHRMSSNVKDIIRHHRRWRRSAPPSNPYPTPQPHPSTRPPSYERISGPRHRDASKLLNEGTFPGGTTML